MEARFSPLLVRLVVLAFACGPIAASAATPWVVRTAITTATLLSEHNRLTASPYNLQPVSINGYEQSGVVRFNALYAKPVTELPTLTSIGVTGASLLSSNTTRQADGYRLVWLNGYGSGTEARYNAVWRRTNGAAQQLRIGQSLSQHQAEDSTLNGQNYRLDGISSYTVNGAAQHAAWWVLAQFYFQTSTVYSQTPAQYQTAFNNHPASQGWRLINVSGYTFSGTERFTAMFRKITGPAWWTMHGLDSTNFDSAWRNAHYTGYRPAFLHTYPFNDAPRSNVIVAHDHGLAPEHTGAIAQAVNTYMQTNARPGLSLAITRRGKLIYASGFGFADTATGEIVGPRHRFRIASVSKPVTAVATLHALESTSSFNVDSFVFGTGRILANDFGTPPYSTRERAITVRRLLNMTSGWVDDGLLWYSSEPSWGSNPVPAINDKLDNAEPAFSPGDFARYANLPYVTAARIVEKISGQTFENYVKQQIFAPSGITDIAIGNRRKADRQAREVTYYPETEDAGPYLIDPRRMDGSTAWIAKPMDMLLFARRMDDARSHPDLINDSSKAQMRTPSGAPQYQGNASMNPNTYGLGWASSGNPIAFWSHNGSMSGTAANLVTRTDEISWAYMANSREGGDMFSGNFTNLINGLIDDITAADGWPGSSYDLYDKVNSTYDSWMTSHFTSTDRNQPGLQDAVWGLAADPDNDGIPNAAEAYFGRDPLVPDPSPYRVFTSGGNFVKRWLRPSGDRGVSPFLQSSTSLTGWVAPLGVPITVRNDLISPIGYHYEEVQVPATNPRRFLRLAFTAD